MKSQKTSKEFDDIRQNTKEFKWLLCNSKEFYKKICDVAVCNPQVKLKCYTSMYEYKEWERRVLQNLMVEDHILVIYNFSKYLWFFCPQFSLYCSFFSTCNSWIHNCSADFRSVSFFFSLFWPNKFAMCLLVRYLCNSHRFSFRLLSV